MNTRKVGTVYEKLAACYLTSQGYTILETNFRCRTGEIDIIARDGRYLVFLEVKYRKNASAGIPAEAVNKKKQRIISHTAAYYCHIHGYGEQTPCRFDVVSICGDRLQLIKNAFEYQYY